MLVTHLTNDVCDLLCWLTTSRTSHIRVVAYGICGVSVFQVPSFVVCWRRLALSHRCSASESTRVQVGMAGNSSRQYVHTEQFQLLAHRPWSLKRCTV